MWFTIFICFCLCFVASSGYFSKGEKGILKKPLIWAVLGLVCAECIWISFGWTWLLNNQECIDEYKSGMGSMFGLLITTSMFNTFFIVFTGFVAVTGHPLKKETQEKVSRSFTLKKAIWFKICVMIMLFFIPDINMISENFDVSSHK